jgi:hypothetical protein
MEWPDVVAFMKHWKTNPPMRRLLQSALSAFGYRSTEPTPAETPKPKPESPNYTEPGGFMGGADNVVSFDRQPLAVQEFLRKVQKGVVQ